MSASAVDTIKRLFPVLPIVQQFHNALEEAVLKGENNIPQEVLDNAHTTLMDIESTIDEAIDILRPGLMDELYDYCNCDEMRAEAIERILQTAAIPELLADVQAYINPA